MKITFKNGTEVEVNTLEDEKILHKAFYHHWHTGVIPHEIRKLRKGERLCKICKNPLPQRKYTYCTDECSRIGTNKNRKKWWRKNRGKMREKYSQEKAQEKEIVIPEATPVLSDKTNII